MDQIRSPQEIAERSLALFAIVGLSFGAERAEVLSWLQQNKLWCSLSPRELGFIDNPSPSGRAIVNATWNAEALVVLAWSLRLFEQLPPADKQCNASDLQEVLPPYADISVRQFIDTAKLRSEDELLAFADECLRLHWEVRDARRNQRAVRQAVNIEIIQERHRAINWIIGYDGASWDEVTTDT